MIYNRKSFSLNYFCKDYLFPVNLMRVQAIKETEFRVTTLIKLFYSATCSKAFASILLFPFMFLNFYLNTIYFN